MSASDAVNVKQLSAYVVFQFDGKVLPFRNAFVTMTSDGLFIKFIARDKRHVAYRLSDNPIMTKQELAHVMIIIKSRYQLHDDNREDVDEILKALNESLYRKGDKEMDNKDHIYSLIEAADKCRKEIVLCLLGKPGIGKTEAVERFAKDHNRNVVHIITSQILPSEVSGMTMPNQETKSMDVFDHYRLSHMKDGDILFFDELLKGQQQVLNACLTLIQERRLMSGTKLPDILIIAAANELSTPVQLPLEIRQRFMFVEVEWDKDSWIDYMKGLGFDREHERLKQLALKIQTSLNNSNASAWNVLTPRTATKLCLWMRDADDKEVVHRFIGNQFDADIATSIRDIACGSAVGLPSQQIAEKVIDIIKPIYIDPHYNDPEDQLSVVMQTAKSVVDGNINDAKDLFNMLKKLPEWEEIKKELANTTIKNDIEF